MNIDPGLAVVIIAVLLFYLRLIILQRQRAKQVKQSLAASAEKSKKGKKPPAPPRYTIISQHKSNRIIGISGGALFLLGVLLRANLLPFPVLQTYWWIPTAIGIVAFSWLFQL